MQRGNVNPQIILAEEASWNTPHAVQSIKRGELRWDEYLHMLVQDLAFGMSKEKWVEQLVHEGNIGLAHELINRFNLVAQEANIKKQEQEWLQMVEMAQLEAEEYLKQQSDEITERDQEEYTELLDLSNQFVVEKAFGDAVSTLEQALNSLKTSVERRHTIAIAAFAAAENKVSDARKLFVSIRVEKFPGGPEGYKRARQLLLQADNRLYGKDYSSATEIARWVEAICQEREYPISEVEELLKVPIVPEISQPMIPGVEEEELSFVSKEEFLFQREWTQEDDEYLIDNYRLMSNGQLNLRLHTTDDELERRINYHGLLHDRKTGKRTRWRNPYVAGSPLRSKTVFVGRSDVFSFIDDNLGSRHQNEDKNLVVLLGHRRTGKTSILLQLRTHRREILEPRIPIFVDIEGLLPFPGGLRNFFWKLACSIQAELVDFDDTIKLPRPVEDDFVQDASWKFQEFLRVVKKATGDRGLVLMLDEFQALDPLQSRLDVDVYKMLRSVIQHDPQVDFILSGTMEMERMIRDYQAAMFGSAISKKIDFLDQKDAEKLIVLPSQKHVTYDQAAVNLIVDVTASHPYFVQLLCWTLMRYLIDQGKSKVFASDVDRILPMALERGVHFDEIWATDTTELELYIMAIVGELAPNRGDWSKFSSIESRLNQEGQLPKNKDDLDEAIANLTNRRIFRRSSDGNLVRFQVDVFGQWISANKPFEVVRRAIRAEAARQRRRIERQPMSS